MGLLKKEFKMLEGGPLARHAIAEAVLQCVDLDQDRALSLDELQVCHARQIK